MAKLTHLESRIAAPFSALVPPPRVGGKVPPPPTYNPDFTCHMLPVWEARTYCPGLQSSVPRSQSDMGSPTSADDTCRRAHTLPSSAFKQLEPMITGATMGKLQDPPLQVNETGDGGEGTPLVGPRNEGEVEVNGMKCRALIDSGSQITSIMHKYCRNHPILQKRKLHPSIIPIEGAAGQSALVARELT